MRWKHSKRLWMNLRDGETMINEIECEVIFNWNEPCEKPWTYHWNDNGNEAGCDEFFKTRAEAEIAMRKRMQQEKIMFESHER